VEKVGTEAEHQKELFGNDFEHWLEEHPSVSDARTEDGRVYTLTYAGTLLTVVIDQSE
jgi:hypothetical protein